MYVLENVPCLNVSEIYKSQYILRYSIRNMYWLLYILDLHFVLFLCTTAVWQFRINEYVILCYGMFSSTCIHICVTFLRSPSSYTTLFILVEKCVSGFAGRMLYVVFTRRFPYVMWCLLWRTLATYMHMNTLALTALGFLCFVALERRLFCARYTL